MSPDASAPLPCPWLEQEDDFARMLDGGGPAAGVVVTKPAGAAKALSLGKVLDMALRGHTHCFTAAVGYFGHAAGAPDLDDDPATILLREGDERLRARVESDVAPPRFRLMYGELAPNALPAQLALRSWYWLCRWHASEEGTGPAGAFLAGVHEAAIRAGDRPGAFADIASRFLRAEPGEDGLIPLALLHDPNAKPPRRQRQRRGWGARRREADEQGVFDDWRRSLQDLTAGYGASSAHQTAAELLLYLITHAGDVRVHPKGGSDPGGRFHAKLYVVERGAVASTRTTVAIAGSGNWSQSAFSSGLAKGNTEVATVHVLSGADTPPSGPEAVGHQLVETTIRLFAEGQVLGRWEDAASGLVPSASDAWLWTKLPDEQAPTRRKKSDLDPKADQAVAAILRSMVARTLGFDTDAAIAHQHWHGAKQFAGAKPAPYQADGALRLLAILRQPAPLAKGGGAMPARGAFLTDEAGLGKTLIAQIVAFELIVEKLRDRLAAGDTTPVRVTYVAPKQVAGAATSDGRADSGWYAHSVAVLREVESSLAPVLDAHGVTDPARWLSERLQSRVISTSALTRRAEGGARAAVLDDLLHIAKSEVVLLDESHNLRNGTAKKTRIARWLLSLPVPGERWKLIVGTQSDRQGKLALDDGPTEIIGDCKRYDRKVLCISATPFNNALEDLITQLGHFATVQDWSRSELVVRRQRALSEDAPALAAWLRTWCDPTRTADHAAAFERMFAALDGGGEAVGRRRGFFASTRALDGEEATQEQRTRKGARTTVDGGPVFDWGPGYEEAEHLFAEVQKYLADMEKVQGTSAATTTTSEGPNRLDTLLAGLFVQRSRVRVLSMEPDKAPEMFRSPNVPRLPLPLNDWNAAEREGVAFEAAVLHQLFSLLGGTSQVGAIGAPASAGLGLLGYQFKALADAAAAGADVNQAARNSFGFLIIGLVKRLQSSPYAFLRTLLSGVFRSSLRWVAIVQALRAETDAARAPMRAQLANAQAGVDAAVGLIDALSDTTKAALTGLLAGEWIASDPRSLARLLGGGSLHADAGKSQEAKTQAEWSNHLTSALASPEPPSWLARLVSDLERGADSRLLEDARTCLRWAFAEPEPWPDARPLYQEIFPDPAATAALGTIVTLGNLRDRLGPPRSWGAADLRHWDEWLRRRLHQDPRAASLLGWLLVQALGRETRFDPHDQKAVTEVLPGGGKSLVFSEYTDTLDYLSCLVLVLGHVGRASSDLVVGVGAWTATLELLKTAMREVIAVAGREARQERARSRGFLEPVAAGWFEQEVSGPAGLERIRRACVRLADEAGLCTGGPHGLLVKNGEAQPPLFDTGAEPTTEDGLEGSDAGVVVERAAVLDAFSPFYQIDPKTRDVDEQSRIRDALAAATARPVHALFATQVLAEGVNLQECGVVVHYDLPWNPTSLVQRNGRVDRRITNVYEDQYQRFKLLDGLGLADSTPPFMAVKQVYHLTVLPAEPSLAAGSPVQFAAADAARSVRATLLRKLNAIRCLFGLSAWPVVLDITDAAAVLTGELDFETPGIRRREELFKQWHALGARIGEFVPPPTGTLLCGVALGDAPGLSEFEAHVAPPARAMPRAVGIQTWDPWKGRLLPVRSGIEWRDRPAITGWLWTNDGALRAWLPRKRESHGRQRFEPVWAEHEARPEAKRNGRTWPLQGLPGGVAAPTSLAEDWLTYFAQAFLDDAKWLDYEPMARYVLPASLLAGTTLQGAGRWFGWIADAAPRSQGDDREVLDSARYEVPSHKLPAELPAVADAQGWNLLAFLDDDLDPSGDDA